MTGARVIRLNGCSPATGTGVQHLPAPAAGEAAGCVGQSPGGGEKDRNPGKSDERDRRHR